MLPVQDHNPTRKKPYVTYGLMAANIIAYAWYTLRYPEGLALLYFYNMFAVIPVEITNGGGYGTLISSIFVHAGLLHLAGNMLLLWIFGDNIEDEMGHLPFLLFYLASGAAAAAMQVAADPLSRVPIVGASGAIAGAMGAYMLLYPRAKIDIFLFLLICFRVVSVPAIWILGIWFAFQFLGGLFTDTSNAGVAYWAHAGGFVAGLVFCLPLWLRRGGTRFWKENRDLPTSSPKETPQGENHKSQVAADTGRTPGPWGK